MFWVHIEDYIEIAPFKMFIYLIFIYNLQFLIKWVVQVFLHLLQAV